MSAELNVGPVQCTVRHGYAESLDVDVLALKFADELYGVERQVLQSLAQAGHDILSRLPSKGGTLLAETSGMIRPRHVLVLGVGPLSSFEYEDIRKFSREVLIVLKDKLPDVEHLAITVPLGYGLDEIEVLKAELAGFQDSVSAGSFPSALKHISIIEANLRRSTRLSVALRQLSGPPRAEQRADAFRSEMTSSAPASGEKAVLRAKARAFVAMPFAEDMDDVFHYGIQRAVRAAGLVCERADLTSFTGDVMSWVKTRISTAELVIADLSVANPNVYLEVGLAWGCGRRTILIARNGTALTFDVRGQRCLYYSKISELESKLTRELQNLV